MKKEKEKELAKEGMEKVAEHVKKKRKRRAKRRFSHFMIGLVTLAAAAYGFYTAGDTVLTKVRGIFSHAGN